MISSPPIPRLSSSMYFHGVRQRGTANLQPEPGSRGGARTVWRRPLASPVRRALYVAISRLLYNTSDGPSVIFQKLVAHPGLRDGHNLAGLGPGSDLHCGPAPTRALPDHRLLGSVPVADRRPGRFPAEPVSHLEANEQTKSSDP
jgi:hypothetical protein